MNGINLQVDKLGINILLSSTLDQPSAQQHALPSQVARLRTHGHYVGNLLRRAQAANRYVLDIAGGALHRLGIRHHAGVANHRRRHVVDRNALPGVLARQVAHHALQARLGGGIMTSVDAAARGSERANEDDAAPLLGLHVRDGQLAEDKTGAQVDGQRVVELVNGDVEDARDALAVAGVGDENVGPVLAVLLLELGVHALDVVCGRNVCLVDRHFGGAGPLGQFLELCHEGVYCVLVARVCHGEVGAVDEEITGDGSADTGLNVSVFCKIPLFAFCSL